MLIRNSFDIHRPRHDGSWVEYKRFPTKNVCSLIENIIIYGSIANATENATSDVDLMVIGDATFADIISATHEAQSALGREINPKVMTLDEWHTKMADGDAFLQHVFSNPRIMLMGDEHAL